MMVGGNEAHRSSVWIAVAGTLGMLVVLVVALVNCAKKKKRTSHVVAPQNSDGNVTFGERNSIVDATQAHTSGIGTSEGGMDWTKSLDQTAVGGARSVKQTKKKKKATAASIYDEVAKPTVKSKDEDETEFGGFGDTLAMNPSHRTGKNDKLGGFDDQDLPALPTLPKRPSGGARNDDSDEEENEDESVPAWYAGKLSRDLCVEAVENAGDGDFLVRESSRGDRCVICINDRGSAVNLVVQVTPSKTYRFAGKERESLHDVIFFLRRKPMTSADGHTIKLSKPAPKAQAMEKDKELREAMDDVHGDAALFHDFSRSHGVPAIPEDANTRVVIGTTGLDMYQSVSIQGLPNRNSSYIDDPFMDDNGEEPLYVDMSDANVPSFEFIAEREEEHRLEQAGHRRLSNQEFADIRRAARERAESAALVNRKKMLEKSVRQRWRQLPSASVPSKSAFPALPPRPGHLAQEDNENFASYEDASAREFGGYEEDEIYEAVPRWFAGRLDRQKCESIIRASQNGTYICRESSSGDKYIVCLKHNNTVKNFQIYIRGAAQFEFSGRKYVSLDAVMQHIIDNGILKNGERIPLVHIANW